MNKVESFILHDSKILLLYRPLHLLFSQTRHNGLMHFPRNTSKQWLNWKMQKYVTRVFLRKKETITFDQYEASRSKPELSTNSHMLRTVVVVWKQSDVCPSAASSLMFL